MTDAQRDAARRAHDALTRALAGGSDDLDHPGYDTLEALVDGRLPDAARDAVDAHVAECRFCEEDVADLVAVRAAIPMEAAAAPRPKRLAVLLISGGLAAAVLLAVWVGTRPATEPTAPALATIDRATPPSPLTPEEQRHVTRATQSGTLDIPAGIAALSGRTGTLLGPAEQGAAFGPIAPRGTAVAATRPRFTWRTMPGATGYTVAVFDDGFNEVARSPRLTSAEWTPERDLPRGRTLLWQVTAHHASGDVTMPAPPQPEARFTIVDAQTAAAIAEQSARLAQEPLALGILLARAGLLDDAAREFERAGTPGEKHLAELRKN